MNRFYSRLHSSGKFWDKWEYSFLTSRSRRHDRKQQSFFQDKSIASGTGLFFYVCSRYRFYCEIAKRKLRVPRGLWFVRVKRLEIARKWPQMVYKSWDSVWDLGSFRSSGSRGRSAGFPHRFRIATM